MKSITVLALLCITTCVVVAQTSSDDPNFNGFTPDPDSSDDVSAAYGCGIPSRSNSFNTFDFIVVGSGAAGSVVANKLSAISNFSVLILEAGKPSQRDLGGTDYVVSSFNTDANGVVSIGTPYTRYDVPLFYKSLFLVPQLAPLSDWVIPGGAQVGKLIGGSHCHNGMFWQHPTQYDIDVRWGIPSWPYRDLIARIRSAENVTGSSLQSQPGHGLSGPIQISDAAVIDTSETVFVNASVSYGIAYNPNLDASPRYGSGYGLFNIRRGVRDSAAIAYLKPALSRSNLNFINPAQVTRVIFSTCNNTKTAIGVQFVRTIAGRNYTFTAYARKEVILSGGAILSPWILLNSGIGPAAQLKTYGKPVVVINENVGQHLANNLNFNMQFQARNFSPPNFWDFSTQYNAYAQFGTGILAAHSNSIGTTYFKTLPNLTDADVGVLINVDAGNLYGKVCGVAIELATPKYANGTVELRSSDPTVTPKYTANANFSSEDTWTLVRAVKIIRGIMAQPAAFNYFGAELVPGPSVATDDQLYNYINGRVATYAHYCSTNKMGLANDTTRVVDDRLRVVGVNGLRVIDASIFPAITNSYVQATVIGVALKGAAMVIADNGF